MKNIIKSVVGMAILAIAGTSFAQATATDATGTASADVICAINIAKVANIYWGKIVSSPNGSATITPNGTSAGAEAYANSSDPGNSQHGNQTLAAFKVTGQSGATYAITHSNFPTLVADASGDVMTVAMTGPTDIGGTALIAKLPSEVAGCNATQTYYYGGTVTESGTGSPAGNYNNTNAGGSGVWSETVTYN